MEVSNLFHYLRNRIVKKQVDFKGDLQVGLERALMENLDNYSMHFIYSDDSRIGKIDVRESYLGESILDVITHLENSYPIHVVANPNGRRFSRRAFTII